MAKIRGGGQFEKKLTELADKLGDPKVVRVGFLENATYPNGTSVAMVAAIQNYGAPAAGIPPRPFFSNMIADKKSGWSSALAKNLKKTGYDVTKTLTLMGEGISGQLRDSIRSTSSPPLKPATVRRKGFATPLIDTGHLLASVDYEVK